MCQAVPSAAQRCSQARTVSQNPGVQRRRHTGSADERSAAWPPRLCAVAVASGVRGDPAGAGAAGRLIADLPKVRGGKDTQNLVEVFAVGAAADSAVQLDNMFCWALRICFPYPVRACRV
ncbi:unnamed protein product [Prorocentrum cordatum]|uniref:Uncharacterized protein n=1 Tax=Prorocentrum cordatum TaxID=2364126 RepID=A0ABN9VFJ0_9DINO|nr:unnamed protein product [Polarella glacialis]